MDKFIEFKSKLENQFGKHIKELRFDQDDNFMSTQFVSFPKELGIISQLSAPRTQQENEVV